MIASAMSNRKRASLSIRGMNARLLRIHDAVSRLASRCSWMCPVGALILIVAAHVYAASWWQTVCYSLMALMIVLLFTSFGLDIAMTSALLKRTDRWFAYVGFLRGVAGGLAFIVLGVLGAWTLLTNALLAS